MAGKLTPKQAIFIAEYLVDGNATRAAIAAGFSEASAAVTGARLLKNRTIAQAITLRQSQRVVKLEITAERVLGELAKLAFYDPGNLFDADGKMRQVKALDEVTRAAISSLEVEEVETFDGEENDVRIVTRSKKVKLADKGQNLERLGKYLKLFTDKLEHSGRLTLEQLVCGGEEEAA